MTIRPSTFYLLLAVVSLLILGSVTAWILGRVVTSDEGKKGVRNLRERVNAWWVMVLVFSAAILMGRVVTVLMFAFASFLAFREFVTLTPTRRADHRPLFLAFFVIIPIQYVLVGIQWYPVFAIFIPVYAFLGIPALIALAGDVERYLERTSKIQWGLMTCVYFVSHAPAILLLDLKGYEGRNVDLLFVFILLVELNDVLQFLSGKLFGRHKITPRVSPNKTWEGFIGGLVGTTLLGACLYPLTPFSVWSAAALAFAVATMGFLGDIVMSAVKRDIGVKDYSNLIPGHGGALDRLDSLAFAAPLFFHLTRWAYGV